MTKSKYSNVLTVLLVILIIAVIIGVGFLVYKYIIKSRLDDADAAQAIAEFDENTDEQDEFEQASIEEATQTSSGGKTKTYYKGFVMLGYITIPATNVQLPILDTVTPESLNTSVAVLYPSNPQLNQPGNVVIIGHNYRNGKFFSNNDKLTIGDIIKIKDTSGTEKTYTIYEKFETTEQDTSFYTRNTNGATEITLSTCTDDSASRIIILARVDE